MISSPLSYWVLRETGPWSLSRELLNGLFFNQYNNIIIHSYAHNYFKTGEQEFLRVSSHGLKWDNEPPKLKRSFVVYLQVVVRSQETRRGARDERVRNYFYGMKLNFYPHIFEVRFADIKIFKIGG